jgi:high-affinity Fe2+/Pb2+ permease
MRQERTPDREARMKAFLKILFPLVICALVLALVFTIIGSSANHDNLLLTGIIVWLAASFLFFSWVVLFMWSKRKKYKK